MRLPFLPQNHRGLRSRALHFLGALMLTGCGAGGSGTTTQEPAAGARALTSSQLEPVAAAEAPGGYELRIFEDRAYVATFTSTEGVSIFDVTDPAEPKHLGGTLGGLSRSISVFRVGEQIILASSADNDLYFFDATEPARVERIATMGFRSHNVTAHPSGVVYNSRHFDQPGGVVEIIDATDPADIHLETAWAFPPTAADGSVVIAQACHDIVLDVPAERAYCAGYQQTLIWDIADPWQPKVLTAISNPLISFHHTAFPILGGRVLLINDEFAGNFTWGCFGNDADDALGTEPPQGAVWFYDLGVSPPAFISWVGAPPAPPEVHILGPLCTSHNGEELDDTGLIAFGWFHAGLMLIDASDPAAPVVVDRDDIGGAVGDARWHRNHVLAVDDLIGLTVLALDGVAE